MTEANIILIEEVLSGSLWNHQASVLSSFTKGTPKVGQNHCSAAKLRVTDTVEHPV